MILRSDFRRVAQERHGGVDDAEKARYMGDVLGRISVHTSDRQSTRVLVAADLEPAAADQAEPAMWN